ncbi:MAG: hypothetical protein GY757_35300 [bacterium]|nr:hypothetical protein [bacterium]
MSTGPEFPSIHFVTYYETPYNKGYQLNPVPKTASWSNVSLHQRETLYLACFTGNKQLKKDIDCYKTIQSQFLLKITN